MKETSASEEGVRTGRLEAAFLHWDLEMTLIKAFQPSTKGMGWRKFGEAERPGTPSVDCGSLVGRDIVGKKVDFIIYGQCGRCSFITSNCRLGCDLRGEGAGEPEPDLGVPNSSLLPALNDHKPICLWQRWHVNIVFELEGVEGVVTPEGARLNEARLGDDIDDVECCFAEEISQPKNPTMIEVSSGKAEAFRDASEPARAFFIARA